MRRTRSLRIDHFERATCFSGRAVDRLSRRIVFSIVDRMNSIPAGGRARVFSWALPLLTALPLALSGDASGHAPHDDVHALTISSDPSGGARQLYIVMRGNLRRSTDEGKTWTILRNGLREPRSNSVIASSPLRPNVVVANNPFGVGGSNLYFSTNGGDEWFTSSFEAVRDNVAKIRFSPNDEKRVVLRTVNGHLHVSDSAGRDWQPIEASAPIVDFEFEPEAHGRLVAATANSIVGSAIAEPSWKTLKQDPCRGSKVQRFATTLRKGRSLRIAVICSGKQTVRVFGVGTQGDWTVAAPKRDLVDLKFITPSRLAAVSATAGAFVFDLDKRAWQHMNRGLTTTKQAAEFGQPDFVGIVVDRARSAAPVLWVPAFDGLFRSRSLGLAWHEVATENANVITGLTLLPSTKCEVERLAVSTYLNGLYVTSDSGASWTKPRIKGRHRLFKAAVSEHFESDRRMFINSWRKFFVSRDAGRTFGGPRRLPYPSRETLRRAKASTYVTYFFLPGLERRLARFVTSAGSVLEFDFASGSFETVDELHVAIYGVAHARRGPMPVLRAISNRGLLGSTDLGRSWKLLAPLESPWCRKIAIASGSEGIVTYIGCRRELMKFDEQSGKLSTVDVIPEVAAELIEEVAASPNYRSDKTLLVSVRDHGLFRSDDAGAHFHEAARELLEENTVFSLSYNPTSPAIVFQSQQCPGVVFGVCEDRIYRSGDAGKSWSRYPFDPPPVFMAKHGDRSKVKRIELGGSAD